MVTLMLVDKPYYDYDYKYYDKVTADNGSELNSDDKTKSILARFGIGVGKDPAEMDMEELQEYGMSLEDK